MEDKVKGQIMRMNSWQKEVTLLGKKVQIFICQTDCGVQLLIAGGDRSHIGSVSIADEQSNLVSHVFDGHRDNVISLTVGKSAFSKMEGSCSSVCRYSL